MENTKDITEHIVELQAELRECRKAQQDIKKRGEHIVAPYNTFAISNSLKEGNKFFDNIIKMATDVLDTRCGVLIDKLTINNLMTTINQINKRVDMLKKTLSQFDIMFTQSYIDLKEQECMICYEILLEKRKLKEIEQAEKEIIREQLREEKKLEKEKERLEREKVNKEYRFTHRTFTDNAEAMILKGEINELENRIVDVERRLKNKRCGYVYVVSNNDMKEGQYKIGITRRSVEERMKELGSGASHSFPMNVHGYVYCDDCFAVESALHRYFAKQRVNQINNKKEWFQTTLPEIKQAFKKVCDVDIELKDVTNDSYLYSKAVMADGDFY